MQVDQPPPSRSTSSRAAIAADYDPATPAASTPPLGSKLSFPEVPAYSPPPPLAPSPAAATPSPALAAASPRQPAQSRRPPFPSPPPRSPKRDASLTPRTPERLIPNAAAGQEAANVAAADLSPTEIHVFSKNDGSPAEVRVHLPEGFPGRMPAGFRMPSGRVPGFRVPAGRMPAGGPVVPPPRAGSHLSIHPAEAGAATASADAQGLASTHRKERLARARLANRELSTDWDGSTASPALSSKPHPAGAAAGVGAPGSLAGTIISQAREKLQRSGSGSALQIQNLIQNLTNRKSDSTVLHDLASRPSRGTASSAALNRARAARSASVPDATTDLEGSQLAQPPATAPRDATAPHTPPRVIPREATSSNATSPRVIPAWNATSLPTWNATSPGMLQPTPLAESRQLAGGPGGHGAVYAPGAIWAPAPVRPATQPVQPTQPAPREAVTEDGSGEAAGGEPDGATRASDSMATASIASTPASPYIASPAVPRMRRTATFGGTDGATTSPSTAATAAATVAAAQPPLPPPPPPRTTPPKPAHATGLRSTEPTEAALGEVRSVAPSQAGAASSEARSSIATDAVPDTAVALPELGAPSSLPLTPARRALSSPERQPRPQEPQPTQPVTLGAPSECAEVVATTGAPKEEVAVKSSPPLPPPEAEVAGLNAHGQSSESPPLDAGREWQSEWSGGISGAEARVQAVQAVRQSFLCNHGRPCSADSSAYASSAYASSGYASDSPSASAAPSPILAASSSVPRPRQRRLSREPVTPTISMASLAQLDGDTVWGEAEERNGLQGVTPSAEGSNARDTAAKALAALDKMGKTFAKLDALTGRKELGAAGTSSPLLSSLYDTVTFPYTFEEEELEAKATSMEKASSTRDAVVAARRSRGADDAHSSADDAKPGSDDLEEKAKAAAAAKAKAAAAAAKAQAEADERARAEAKAAEEEAANAKVRAVARAQAQARADAEAARVAAAKERAAARARLEEAARVALEARAAAEAEAEAKAAAAAEAEAKAAEAKAAVAAAKAQREVEERAVAEARAAEEEAHVVAELAVKPGADDAASQLAVTAAATAPVAGASVPATTTKQEAAAAAAPVPPTTPRLRVANPEGRHPLEPPDSGGRVRLSRRFSDDCAARGSSAPAAAAAAARISTPQQQTQAQTQPGRDADGSGTTAVFHVPRRLTSDLGEASADPTLAARRFLPAKAVSPSMADLMSKFEAGHTSRGTDKPPVPRHALPRSDDAQTKASLTSCNTPPPRRSLPSGSGCKPASLEVQAGQRRSLPSVSVSSPSQGVSSPSLLSLRSELNSTPRRDAYAVRDEAVRAAAERAAARAAAVQSARTQPHSQVQAASPAAASPAAVGPQGALRRPMSQAIAEANAAEARTAVVPRRRRGADDAQVSDDDAMSGSEDEAKAKLAAAAKAKAVAEREAAAAAAKAEAEADEQASTKIVRASSMAVNRQQQLSKLLALEQVEDLSACSSPSSPSARPEWPPPPPPLPLPPPLPPPQPPQQQQPPPPPQPPPPSRADGAPRVRHADSSDRAARHAPQPPPGSAAMGRARAARRAQREASGNFSLAGDAGASRAQLLAGAPASAADPMAAALQAALAGYAAPALAERPSRSLGEQSSSSPNLLAQQGGEPSYASPASIAWLQAEAASGPAASTESSLAAAAAPRATASGRLRTSMSYANTKGREVLRAARSVAERGYVARDATSTPPRDATPPQRRSGSFSSLSRASSSFSSLLRASSSFTRRGSTKGTEEASGSRS